MKELSGCVNQRSEWATNLYTRLLFEFDRLRSVGMKMNTGVLRQILNELIKDNNDYVAAFNIQILISGNYIVKIITSGWVQNLMVSSSIDLKDQCGK